MAEIKTKAVADAAVEGVETPPVQVRSYFVVVDAVSMEVGKYVNDSGVEKNRVERLMNGQRLDVEGDGDLPPAFVRLLELGAIMPSEDYKPGSRRTPRGALRFLSPEMDPGETKIRKASRHEIEYGGPLL